MNKVAVSDIKRGMRFSAPVFFDDGKNMFLAEGKSVKGYHVAALERWDIPFVLTNGHEMKGDELSRYMARAKKKARLQSMASAPAVKKSSAPVNMEDTADVTDLFADDIAESIEGESGGAAPVSPMPPAPKPAPAPKQAAPKPASGAAPDDKDGAKAPAFEAEDVTSMFM